MISSGHKIKAIITAPPPKLNTDCNRPAQSFELVPGKSRIHGSSLDLIDKLSIARRLCVIIAATIRENKDKKIATREALTSKLITGILTVRCCNLSRRPKYADSASSATPIHGKAKLITPDSSLSIPVRPPIYFSKYRHDFFLDEVACSRSKP